MTIAYAHRLNAFRDTATYEVGESALKVTLGEKVREFPYEGIREIRMSYAPSRVQTNRYQMLIYMKRGGKLEVSNESYASFANFSSHDADYAAFAQALHGAIRRNGADVKFVYGSSMVSYVGNSIMLAILGVLLIVTLPLFFEGYGDGVVISARLLIIISLLPPLYYYMKRNKPLRVTPADIPETALPKGEA